MFEEMSKIAKGQGLQITITINGSYIVYSRRKKEIFWQKICTNEKRELCHFRPEGLRSAEKRISQGMC